MCTVIHLLLCGSQRIVLTAGSYPVTGMVQLLHFAPAMTHSVVPSNASAASPLGNSLQTMCPASPDAMRAASGVMGSASRLFGQRTSSPMTSPKKTWLPEPSGSST